MKKRLFVSIAALILSVVLVFCGCGKGNDASTQQTVPASHELTDFGSGATSFVFEVVDVDGNVTVFNVHTDEKTVGAALQEYELIKGEQGDYGIYIKEVNGIIADYDIDGTYWAFYVDGAMSMTGVDQVEIVEGSTYSFRVEKG
ncbi:MAG: DUF4430 domain-containing protein [Clostridia bacterium]|nr:DUF4430 domain-containing protein [Clostridia bacterium]